MSSMKYICPHITPPKYQQQNILPSFAFIPEPLQLGKTQFFYYFMLRDCHKIRQVNILAGCSKNSYLDYRLLII